MSILMQRRPSEPSDIYVVKLLFFIILNLAVLAFFATSCLKVAQDHSTLQQSRDFPPRIVGPNVQFSAPFNYNLSCQIFYTNSARDDPTGNDCIPYISQPLQESDGIYYGFFNGTLYFSGYLLADIDEIQVNITSLNQTNTQLIEFRLYDADPEFENIQPYNPDGSRNPPDNLNLYHLAPGLTHFVEYRRFRNDTLIRNFKNYLGVPPTTWSQEFFMTSSFESISIPNLSQNQYGFIHMALQSTEVDNMTEIQGSTILNALSLMGGAFTLGLGIYVFLFGPQTPQPWGFIQRLPCCSSRIKKGLQREYGQQIPLSVSSVASGYTNGLPNIANRDLPTSQFQQTSILERVQILEDYIKSLNTRQSKLELFLREYVVDPEFLDTLEDGSVQLPESLAENDVPVNMVDEQQRISPQQGYNMPYPMRNENIMPYPTRNDNIVEHYSKEGSY